MKNYKQFTEEDINQIQFREKIFIDEIKKYNDFTLGGGSSILHFVRDNNGKYSEEKTWDFINELIWYANTYTKIINKKSVDLYISQGISQTDAEYMVGFMEEFTKEQYEYIQSYLYCAIRIEELNAWRNTGGKTQTFNGLLKYANDIYDNFGNYFGALADWEMGNMEFVGLKGLYGDGSWLRFQLTNEYLTDKYSKSTQKEYMNFMSPNICFDEMIQKGLTPTEYRKMQEDIDWSLDDDFVGNDYNDDTPESWNKEKLSVYKDKMNKETELKNKEKERIHTSFDYKNEFVKQYDRFVDSRLKCNILEDTCSSDEELALINMHKMFPDILKEAIRLFTIAHKLSFIMDDDGFFTSVGLLRQSAKRLEKLKK